jgi:hypothetical protein
MEMEEANARMKPEDPNGGLDINSTESQLVIIKTQVDEGPKWDVDAELDRVLKAEAEAEKKLNVKKNKDDTKA